MIESNNKIDAKDWIIKYKIDDSIVKDALLDKIKEIKEIKLISKPIQILNQELEEITSNDLKITIIKKINLEEFLKIKRKINFIDELWTH